MSKHSAKFNELVKKLREIFQIDRPELDFGVYRILNARAGEINDYLENRLPEKIKAALDNGSTSHKEQTERELKEKESQYKADGINPDTVPKVLELRQKLAAYGNGTAEHENAVFSHLLAFFSRYYDNGDFISQRRYKGDTYAIPYAGEEVMLHWANKDQYYTKSGENFSNYSFKLDDGQGGHRLVHCRLVAADTAKDNRKDNDKERRFALIARKIVTRIDDEGDEYEEELLPVESIEKTVLENGKEISKASELILRFEYLPMPKGSKQADLTGKAVAAILADPVVKAKWLDLGQRAPTEKNPQRTLLEKHLSDYTTKNLADYFIHKDLGGFLKRELDFYIKNEVMHLDDVQNAEKFADIEKSLRMIQCLRAIALELVTFLAQLEEFQKKLWLKKKFVVSSHYCFTLDRIIREAPDLLSAIASCDPQWEQWDKLGMLEGKKDDLFCQEESRSIAYLKQHPNLMVDTSCFNLSFRNSLLGSLNNLDEHLDGLIINSDNFQALELIRDRYQSVVNTIYIDPPYNTDGGPICYKNGYRSSSWASLLFDRLSASQSFLRQDGVLCATIDDYQQKELHYILGDVFGVDQIAGTVAIRINPSGRPVPSGFAQAHEYAIFALKSEGAQIGKLERTAAQSQRYKEHDSDGSYMWELFRKRGSNSERYARPSLYYPIYAKENKIRVPNMIWDEKLRVWSILEASSSDEEVLYPIDDSGTDRTWRWKPETISEDPSQFCVKIRDGVPIVYYKFRPSSDGVLPLTFWGDAKYSATEHGTGVLKNLFSGPVPFSYPKSIYAVVDCISIAGMTLTDSICLDYFAGSGTTGQAVIALNKSDGGKRRYILVEQGEYLDTVLKPRLQKVAYSSDWKDGKPTTLDTGISHAFKVIKLESYEDTLNNLELRRSDEQQDLLSSMTADNRDDYLLRYMLDVESRGSLLSVDAFKKPFDVSLKVAVDSAGAFEARKIDLVETFNYLIGLSVKQMELATDRGYARVEGTLPSGESVLILWRDCERIDYEELTRYINRFDLNTREKTFDVVYINGDHNIPSVFTETEAEGGSTRSLKLRQIEPEFLKRMFSVEDI